MRVFHGFYGIMQDMIPTIICLLLTLTRGQALELKPRIVNGTKVKIGEIPFQVSLQAKGQHFCGGAILNKNYVITAAHCVYGRDFHIMRVVVGTVNVTVPGQIHTPVEVTVHRDYKPSSLKLNDIALMKVEPELIFSDAVQPVLLPDYDVKIPTETQVVVSGWGKLGGAAKEQSEILLKARIRVADQNYCRDVLKEKGYEIHSTQICAYDPTYRRGHCRGDSGGPLTANGILVGIVSWSSKDPYCASTKYPGVYTRVSEFIKWIKDSVK
ncbi:hypothetical protein QAD02_019768 [Eretmocerus hayati]|uniref:Uncharacterized protein n=1 Tax=Eretmocerus hayati TaxID=131215 RepID=A0ACC2PKI9_9HYME|nr:hypothetical protein QAD02_019768 [Eretmocerus hayati]